MDKDGAGLRRGIFAKNLSFNIYEYIANYRVSQPIADTLNDS